MTRAQLVKNIQQVLDKEHGVKVTKEIIRQIIDIEENEIYQIIATHDRFSYVWGTIWGEESKPSRIVGYVADYKLSRKNHGWSMWKKGVPKIKWSKLARVYDEHSPLEYFELPQHKYTTQAYKFRKDWGLEEIPEYAGLDDDKILELCRKADEIEFLQNPVWVQRRKKKNEYVRQNDANMKHIGWLRSGYHPVSAGDWYKGEGRDTVDLALIRALSKSKNISDADILENIRSVIDYAIFMEKIDEHPELYDMEKEYVQKVKDQGLQEHVHITKFMDRQSYAIRFKKEEDPWNLKEFGDRKINALRKKKLKEVYDKIDVIMAAPTEERERVLDILIKNKIVSSEAQLVKIWEEKLNLNVEGGYYEISDEKLEEHMKETESYKLLKQRAEQERIDREKIRQREEKRKAEQKKKEESADKT